MSADAPSGDGLHEEEAWDAVRIEEADRLLTAQGIVKLVAVAQDAASGRLVAFSELGLPADHPTEAWQFATLVLREHRGHRLGLALECVGASFPDVTLVVTNNAADNAPMIAVNTSLGFEVAAAGTFWRKEIAAGPTP